MFDDCTCEFDGESWPIEDGTIMEAEFEGIECCECGQYLEEGDKFEIQIWVNEGNIDAYATCVPCARIRESLFQCGWVFGQMWRTLRDQYGLTPNGVEDGDWPEENEVTR